MAMNLGYQTTKLFIGNNIRITNDQYDNGFDAQGLWQGNPIQGGRSGINLTEADYIDLGIVTNESEQVSIGGITVPIPFTSNKYTWNIGQRLIRLTITGIIPDGLYTGIGLGKYNSPVYGKSNASVFRYKLNKFITLNTFISAGEGINWVPGIVQYRRKYLIEIDDDASNWEPEVSSVVPHTKLAKWTVSGYTTSFINGTRNLSYTLNLDYSNNNVGLKMDSYVSRGIMPRELGDFK
jgi:hypothetical protein